MDFILSFLNQPFIRVALFIYLFFTFLLLFFCSWAIFIAIDFIKFLKSVLGDYACLIFIINCLCFNGIPRIIIVFLGIFHNFSCFFFIELINTLKYSSFRHIRTLWTSLRIRGCLAWCDSRPPILILNLRDHSRENRHWIFKTVIPSYMPHTLGVYDRFSGFLTWVLLYEPCSWVLQLFIEPIFE
jgi:hypothetical protein